MTVRDIEIEADAIDAFEATVEVLERALTESAFKEVLSESPCHYAIEWSTLLSGARYDFRFDPGPDGVTVTEAKLEFSGVLGPLLRLVRSSGNGPHLKQILGDIRDLAESEEFYQDEDASEDNAGEDDSGAEQTADEADNEDAARC